MRDLPPIFSAAHLEFVTRQRLGFTIAAANYRRQRLRRMLRSIADATTSYERIIAVAADVERVLREVDAARFRNVTSTNTSELTREPPV